MVNWNVVPTCALGIAQKIAVPVSVVSILATVGVIVNIPLSIICAAVSVASTSANATSAFILVCAFCIAASAILAVVIFWSTIPVVVIPVTFVITQLAGVQSNGVTRVGDVLNTATPVPVLSVKAVERFSEVNEPRDEALPTEVTAPVRFAFVVTVDASVAFATAEVIWSPEIDLLVRVSTVAFHTRVSVASGNVIVFGVVNAVAIVQVIAVRFQATDTFNFFVGSSSDIMLVVVSERDLLVRVSTVAFHTRVSVASGNVIVFDVVNAVAIVQVIAVRFQATDTFNFFVGSSSDIMLVVVSERDLL
ncbi:MAG: hypothetical protein ACYC25_02850, partial [Paludibacter sp.]